MRGDHGLREVPQGVCCVHAVCSATHVWFLFSLVKLYFAVRFSHLRGVHFPTLFLLPLFLFLFLFLFSFGFVTFANADAVAKALGLSGTLLGNSYLSPRVVGACPLLL
jgi:hypothetical protein